MGYRVGQDRNNAGILRRLFGRRGIVDSCGRQAAVLAVSSGKGGTGKSFVASNLAVALSQQGKRVALIDCDFGLGNAHLLMGINPRWTLQHVLSQQVPIENVITETELGPDLIPAGSGISRLADLSENDMFALAHGLEHIAAAYDVLLLDSAAGISPQCLLTLLLAERVLLVTNPEIAALTDAYALIKCLARQPRRPAVSVVVNRVPSPNVGRVTFDKLANVAGKFASYEMHYLGEILDDPRVTQRRLGQPPLLTSHPDCPAARSLVAIASALGAGPDGLGPRDLDARAGMMQRYQTHAAARMRRTSRSNGG